MATQPRQQIFRKAALDRLASPDQLDRPVRLVRPASWLLVLAIFSGILGGIAWATVARAPVRVAGEGILINQTGLVEIISQTNGRLENVSLKVGDIVKVGQVVARLSRQDLLREIASARSALGDASLRYNELTAFYSDQAKADALTNEERLKTIKNTRNLLIERKALLEEKMRNIKILVDRKVVLNDRLIDAQLSLSNARERLSILDEEKIAIKLKTAEKQSVRHLDMLDKRLGMEDLKRKSTRLKARLSDQEVIRATHAGRVVELKVNPGEVVQPGSALATIVPVNTNNNLIALLFMKPGDGKRVVPGMVVQIAPSTVRVQEYGFIYGEVESVSPLPVTPEGMRRILQNDKLVTQLSANGAPIEVRVVLKQDTSTITGFAWSSSKGPAHAINGGTLLSGEVVIREVRVLELIIPGIMRMTGASTVLK